MFFKTLFFIGYLLATVNAGKWRTIALNKCIGAKNNQYAEFSYPGPSRFIIALKLQHTTGKIGCSPAHKSNWGCSPSSAMNIIITDTRNKRIFPAPSLITPGTNGNWYISPGYNSNSPSITFAVPGFRWLYHGQTFRIWYGEDLLGYTESDNHGKTCMNVLVYTTLV
ncbi:uncharacterized protein LOC124444794 isoform X1 [Xenia sp. Carnegie-2017]|uniref:uncharacterized protein LOC124444794 isoform X1 n=1 Tax=Xenia sp. Carnegie-2017 TaxID=2897299 RepID=UPI001F039E46|nr:uncharacterized protein LOC124444794 isoform X1 [Xenia sp. Carnegie-2017]